MSKFPETHVDLMSNVTFDQEQLRARWAEELNRVWPTEVQDNLRDLEFDQMSDTPLFSPTPADLAMLQAFKVDKAEIITKRRADEALNAKLIATIAYEQAVRQKADLELRINGREAVAEVPEVKDPETGEITREYVPAVTAVEPLPATIEQEGETVDNPAYVQAVADLADAQAVIDGASAEVLALVAERA